MPNSVAVSAYRKLIDDISRLYEDARRSQVRFAWETGKRIVEVEQKGAVHAQYGARLLEALSEDLTRKYGAGFSSTNLRNMRLFYLAHKIQQPAAELTLTSHLELLRVRDPKARRTLERRALDDGLTKYDLRALIRQGSGRNGKTSRLPGSGEVKPLPPLKRPTGLKLHTYAKSGADIDCGFYILVSATKDNLAGITLSERPSYTYAATVERVVDGDTLWARIEVGFGVRLREKLRLAGINTPELGSPLRSRSGFATAKQGTPAGEKVRKHVEKLLPVGALIVIRSQKDDKYGRFVADIFYKKGATDPQAIVEDGGWLNGELLDQGLAVRYE